MADYNQAQNLINIESLINTSSGRIETLTKEYKEHKGMLEALFENDDEYQKLLEEIQKLSKLKALAKQKVLKRPESATTQDKIKELKLQLKELKDALSDYLAQYVQLAGTNQIESPDGVIHKIIYTAKLVKSKA